MLGLAVVVAPGGSPRTSVNGRYGIPESRFILHIERGVAECGELFGDCEAAAWYWVRGFSQFRVGFARKPTKALFQGMVRSGTYCNPVRLSYVNRSRRNKVDNVILSELGASAA
jgi:hypothetical protein